MFVCFNKAKVYLVVASSEQGKVRVGVADRGRGHRVQVFRLELPEVEGSNPVVNLEGLGPHHRVEDVFADGVGARRSPRGRHPLATSGGVSVNRHEGAGQSRLEDEEAEGQRDQTKDGRVLRHLVEFSENFIQIKFSPLEIGSLKISVIFALNVNLGSYCEHFLTNCLISLSL